MWRRRYMYLSGFYLYLCSALVSASGLMTQFDCPQHDWADYLNEPDALAEIDVKRLQQDRYLGLFIQEMAVQELIRLWTLSQQPDFSPSQFPEAHYNFSSMVHIKRQGRTPFAYFATTKQTFNGEASSNIQIIARVQAHANQGQGDTGAGLILNVPLNYKLSFSQLQQFESLARVKAWARQESRLGE